MWGEKGIRGETDVAKSSKMLPSKQLRFVSLVVFLGKTNGLYCMSIILLPFCFEEININNKINTGQALCSGVYILLIYLIIYLYI